jgi:uncharacterized membrane protein YkvA (DUF1232 family)
MKLETLNYISYVYIVSKFVMDKNEKYKKFFSEQGMWVKIKHFAKQIGVKTIYMVLLMFNAYKRPNTPKWAKNIIIGAIGYFISPIDALPDLTPFLGYTDDLGILGFGLVTIAGYVNNDVRIASRKQLKKIFGEIDLEELKDIDAKI